MLKKHTEFQILDVGTVNTQRGRDLLLEPHVVLFRGAVGSVFIFMDNTCPLKAQLVGNFL